MSESADPNPASPASPPPGDDIPVAKPVLSSAPATGLPGPRPIFDIEEDRCPKCGEVMEPTAVVCLKCGYDQRANKVREVETGTIEAPLPVVDEAEKIVQPEFVVAGRASAKTLAIAGAVLTVTAVTATCVWRPHTSFWLVVGWSLYTLYCIAINVATGVAAVAVGARLNQQAFGRLDLAAARMFAAYALFETIRNARLPSGYWLLSGGVPLVAAAGLYFLAIMILFKKDRQTAGVIGLAHLILWTLVSLGPTLYTAINMASATKAP